MSRQSKVHWIDDQPPSPSSRQAGGAAAPRREPAGDRPPNTPLLDQIARDLTRLAGEGRLAPLYGRERELVQLQRILLRKQKSNPLLVGAPGVGKTTLVEGLATSIVRGEAAAELLGHRVVEISPSALVSGTGYRGSLEARMEALLSEASSTPRLILFIDEVHTLIRAGAAQGSLLDAANILKPALARGDIRCIGATTSDEYDRFIHSDTAFERRFEPLILEEPAESDAVDIVQAALMAFESHHRVIILPEAAEAAVKLSGRHILDRRLPDKAFDLLDAACTLVRLPDTRPAPGEPRLVDAAVVAQALAERLHIPVEKLDEDLRARLAGLEAHLGSRIIGQPMAIRRIASAVRGAYAGLGTPDQPKYVLAFFGASGVGKTATAKALAQFLFSSPDALIRLDMSEFKEPHSISRLLGAPPGYVGYDDEGTFATRLRRQPFSVVLLDEVEKAHPEVHDAFLQVFDEGRFTDARGRRVDARHAVFILTSNLFAVGDVSSPDRYDDHASTIRQNLAAFFRVEFINRINEIVLFRELALDDLVEIARLEIRNLNARLSGYRLSVEPSEEALRRIAEEACEPGSGARAVSRLVAKEIAEPISAALIAGTAPSPGVIELSVGGGGLALGPRC